MSASKRTTIYLEPELFRALKFKAAEAEFSVSELVNAAVRQSLAEDAEDFVALRKRAREPDLDFEKVVRDLRRRGKV